MLRALGSSVLLPPHPSPHPLSFFNQMACSGVERIKTAAAATADDSVQFWKAHKHMHIRTTQEHTAASIQRHTHTDLDIVRKWFNTDTVSINTYVHAHPLQRHQHMHELPHMHEYTVPSYTFSQAKMHITHLNMVSLLPLLTRSQCLSLNTVSFWTAATICHVSSGHVIWAVRFLTHRLTPVSSNARHSHQALQMVERQIHGQTEGVRVKWESGRGVKEQGNVALWKE